MPAVDQYLLDTFTEAGDTELPDHTMDDGPGWTEESGDWYISSNILRQRTDTGSGIRYLAVVDAGQSDFIIHARIRFLDSRAGVGIVFRESDSSNFWELEVRKAPSSASTLYRWVAGSVTWYDSVVWIPPANNIEIELTVICNGNDITVYTDGGYMLNTTDSFNNTATKVGVIELRGDVWNRSAIDDFQVVSLSDFPWTRQGTVISEVADNVYEPSVLYDSDPQILTEETNVFKMWYLQGWALPVNQAYAESADGLTWTKYGANPLSDLVNYVHGQVFMDGDTYCFVGVDNTLGTGFDLYTSADGLSWGLDTADILTCGAGGAWDDYLLGNCYIWKEGVNDWRMMYESRAGSGPTNPWKLGYATSSDLTTWLKSGSNPVLAGVTGSIGGMWVIKDGSYYYLWAHRGPRGTAPTYIGRYRSSNLTTWTPYPYPLIIPRVGAEEGVDTIVGQVADSEIIIVGGTAYLYFSAGADGTQASGLFHVVVATADAAAVTGWSSYGVVYTYDVIYEAAAPDDGSVHTGGVIYEDAAQDDSSVHTGSVEMET